MQKTTSGSVCICRFVLCFSYLHVTLGTVRVGLVAKIRAAARVVRGRVAVVLAVCGLELVVVAGVGHLVVVADGVVGTGRRNLLRVDAATALAAVVVGLAAADGEEPEQAGDNGEGGTDPDADKEVGVDGAVDAVLLSRGLDCADDNNSHGGGETSSNNTEDDGGNTNQPCQAREDASAVGKNSKDELSTENGEGNDEGNLGVAGDGREDVEGGVDLVGQVNVGTLHTGELADDIVAETLRGPVELGLGAVPAVVLDLAVAPERNIVLVAQPEIASGDGDIRAASEAAEVDVEVADYVLDVGLVQCKILEVDAEHVQAVVGDTREDGDHEGDDGADGQDDGEGHAKEASGSHDGGVCGVMAVERR